MLRRADSRRATRAGPGRLVRDDRGYRSAGTGTGFRVRSRVIRLDRTVRHGARGARASDRRRGLGDKQDGDGSPTRHGDRVARFCSIPKRRSGFDSARMTARAVASRPRPVMPRAANCARERRTRPATLRATGWSGSTRNATSPTASSALRHRPAVFGDHRGREGVASHAIPGRRPGARASDARAGCFRHPQGGLHRLRRLRCLHLDSPRARPEAFRQGFCRAAGAVWERPRGCSRSGSANAGLGTVGRRGVAPSPTLRPKAERGFAGRRTESNGANGFREQGEWNP